MIWMSVEVEIETQGQKVVREGKGRKGGIQKHSKVSGGATAWIISFSEVVYQRRTGFVEKWWVEFGGCCIWEAHRTCLTSNSITKSEYIFKSRKLKRIKLTCEYEVSIMKTRMMERWIRKYNYKYVLKEIKRIWKH